MKTSGTRPPVAGRLEAVELPAPGVARDRDVEQAEARAAPGRSTRRAGQDQPGAGREHRLRRRGRTRSSGAVRPERVEQPELRRALAARAAPGRRRRSRSAGGAHERARRGRAPRARARAPRSRPGARARRCASTLTTRAPRTARSRRERRDLEPRASPRRGPCSPRRASPASCQCVIASTIARARRAGSSRQEDAAADEDRLGAERHAQRRVGRRRDAAGGEVRHRQLARRARPASTSS